MWPGISSILSYGLQFVKFLTGGLDLKINVSYTITTVSTFKVRFIDLAIIWRIRSFRKNYY